MREPHGKTPLARPSNVRRAGAGRVENFPHRSARVSARAMSETSDRRLPRRVSTLRLFAAGGVGACACALALLLGAARLPFGAGPRPVRYWASDRDAHRVFGLDADLVTRRTIDCGWPRGVEVRADGGLWVLRSGGPSSLLGDRLDSFSAAGDLENEMSLAAADVLALCAGQDALVIDAGAAANGHDRVWRVAPDGTGTVLYEAPALTCLASVGRDVWLGSRTGRLARIASDGSRRVVAAVDHDAEWGALAPGPQPGQLYALDLRTPRRLCLVSAELELRWATALGIDARALAPVASSGRVWVADSSGARVRRYGPTGQLDFEVPVALFGPDRPLALADGGVLCAAPGAILRLDANGQVLPGQGGFSWLSDLARVP